MPWLAYKTALSEHMQNSSTIDGLISFILKPRDNGCPISFGVAERIAERRLLNDDGIEMSKELGWNWYSRSLRTKKNKPFRYLPESNVRRLPMGPGTTWWRCKGRSTVMTPHRSGSSSRATAMTLLPFG
jgi:hypothetical protein